MTQQSGASGIASGSVAGGILGGTFPSPTYAGGGTYPPLTGSSAYIAANVQLTPINTAVDILTLSLAAGSYLLLAVVQVLDTVSSASTVSLRLWDGTTTYANDSLRLSAPNIYFLMFLPAFVVLGSLTTVRLTGLATVATSFAVPAGDTNAPANKASGLIAIRIA